MTAAAFSFQGSRRKQNEDCYYLSPDRSIFVVADGMGGCPAGDVASQLTVNTLAEELSKVKPIRSKRQALAALSRAFQQANSSVVQFGRLHDCMGLGAAVVAAVCSANRIYISGLGDCRAYLFRGGSLQQLTTDDTLASCLFKTKLVNADQINRHAFKNILARCIGADPFQNCDELSVVSLRPGERLLLCSDGLFNAISESEIESVLGISENVVEAVSRLRAIAKASMARDDTTCVAIYPVDVDHESRSIHSEASAPRECTPGSDRATFLNLTTPIETEIMQ